MFYIIIESKGLMMCVFAQFYSIVAKFELFFSLPVYFHVFGNWKTNLYVSIDSIFFKEKSH